MRFAGAVAAITAHLALMVQVMSRITVGIATGFTDFAQGYDFLSQPCILYPFAAGGAASVASSNCFLLLSSCSDLVCRAPCGDVTEEVTALTFW